MMRKLLLFCAILPACRMANMGSDSTKDAAASGANASERQGESAAVPVIASGANGSIAKAIGISLASGSSSANDGVIVGKLILQLDYSPEAKPGGISQASCQDVSSGHLVIGRVKCDSQDQITMDLQIKHLDQVCFAASKEPRQKAAETLKLVGCSGAGATVQIFQNDPTWNVQYQK